jgi:hypothetical protein
VTYIPDETLTLSARRCWYNPKLDPRLILGKMTPAMADAVISGKYDDGSVQQSGPLNEPDATHPANLISSLCADGLHRPALVGLVGFYQTLTLILHLQPPLELLQLLRVEQSAFMDTGRHRK